MTPRPRFFIPNSLSVFRIFVGIALPLLLVGPLQKVPFSLEIALALFLLGALSDFFDGWMARRYGLETPLGRILDPTADKIFILAAMASFAALQVYSYWFLVPIFIREIAVTFCRVAWLTQGHAVGAERAGKIKLGFQVASIIASFVYLFFTDEVFWILNYLLLIAAIILTIYSGAFFFRHNLTLLKDRAFLRTVSALGVGYLRPAPGTYGSLLGLVVALLVAHDFWLHLFIFLLFLWIAYFVIPRLGLKAEEDPGEIVIDEFCGMLLAVMALPLNVTTLVAGFLLFRIFDIVKPPPLRWLENRGGVHGIMLDDLGAGIYTWLILKFFFV